MGMLPRVGLQLRRLGAASVNLYDYAELCEEAKGRDAEEGLRLFHVAATRACERLILSGVVKPEAGRETKPGTPVIERIVEGLGIDAGKRLVASPVPPPQPREGLDATFDPSEIAVRVNLPSPSGPPNWPRRGATQTPSVRLGEGPAPLVERRPPPMASRPLSYTAISAYEDCAYRFFMEQVLGLTESARSSDSHRQTERRNRALPRIWRRGPSGARKERARRRRARAARVEPGERMAGAARGAGAAPRCRGGARSRLRRRCPRALLAPVRGWLGSSPLRERDRRRRTGSAPRCRSCSASAGTVLRGSIDLLVEREGSAPLVVDYKTDRLRGASPAPALGPLSRCSATSTPSPSPSPAAARGRGRLCLPRAPRRAAVHRLRPRPRWTRAASGSPRHRPIGAGEFPVAPPEERSWSLCSGCPALRRLCSGPAPASPPARPASAP